LTLFDIIAVLILGVSMLVGFVRGALGEVATVVSFVLAVLISIFGLRITGPIARAAVHPAWAATGVALVVVFLAAYIGLRVAASGLTRSVHSTRALGTIDRVVGAGFGGLRGLVALGVLYLLLNLAPSPNGTPEWIANAKLYPLARTCADALRVLGPKSMSVAKDLTSVLPRAVNAGTDDSSADSAAAQSGAGGQ
jgi:membrane protein required for colicin V production